MASAALQRKAAELGKLTVHMTTAAGSGHPSSALSLAHIVTHLMYRQMRYDPQRPWHPTADRLVLSEGHAVPIVYAALADLGAKVGQTPDNATTLTTADLDSLRARDSVLDGHPNPAEGMPFFDAATGSLGQGLSVAAGLALAARLDRSDRRIYTLVGDGESREGQIWEALDFIVDHQLTSICTVFNANGQGQAADVSPQQSADTLARKLDAYGFEVVTIDGHNPDEIASAFSRFGQTERPLAIVARTIKGWGVPQFQTGNWHGKPLPADALAAADDALDAVIAQHAGGADIGPPPAPPASGSPRRVDPREIEWPAFDEAMQQAGLGKQLEKGRLATRRAYGAALRAASELVPQVVVLDGDVSNSTFTEFSAKDTPERFVECKIAEQSMVSTGAGFSAAGFIPFANSFAKFLSRAADQIELASISRANLKLVGSHAGISLGADGPSQMGLVDVTFFGALSSVRGLPGEQPLCHVFLPADAVAAYQCTKLMLGLPGLCYMRTHRPDMPLLYDPEATFEPGGVKVLSGGEDLAIVASGYMVHVARQTVDLLAKQSIRAALVDAYALPINPEPLLEALQRSGGRALVVEDNYGGGVGAYVAQIAARAGGLAVETLHCQRIPKSCRTADEVMELCGVSAANVADHATALLRRPRG
jgi:transketolase